MNRNASINIVALRSLATAMVLAILCLPVSAQEYADRDTTLSGTQWKAFQENLAEAIHEGNEGAKLGALSQIARYGDFLSFDQLTVFEVMRMYRDGDEVNNRRLAVVALGNMGSKWAIEFLDMLSRYEEDETVKSTMEAVVREHRAKESM